MVQYISAKAEMIRKLEKGAEIHVEGVIGGKTVKNGPIFFYEGKWWVPAKYFDQGIGPGKEYNEQIDNLIVGEPTDELKSAYVMGCYAENGTVIHDPETGPGATCTACEMLCYMIHDGDL